MTCRPTITGDSDHSSVIRAGRNEESPSISLAIALGGAAPLAKEIATITAAPSIYAPSTYAPSTYAPSTYAPSTYASSTYAPSIFDHSITGHPTAGHATVAIAGYSAAPDHRLSIQAGHSSRHVTSEATSSKQTLDGRSTVETVAE